MNRLNDTDVKTKNSCDVVTRAIGEAAKRPEVTSFFDEPSNTASHVVRSPVSRRCAVIDSVLDYDAASGRTATESADELIAFIRQQGLEVEWILETHVHADHLSAAPYIKKRLGGALGIGENIRVVQDVFGKVFNAGTEFQRDGSQFDHLFIDGELFAIGDLDAVAVHTPGHTPACVTYVIGDAAFVGDTLFMPRLRHRARRLPRWRRAYIVPLSPPHPVAPWRDTTVSLPRLQSARAQRIPLGNYGRSRACAQRAYT